MKSKVFISALAVVIACFPEPAEAQFFKKLGKALEQRRSWQIARLAEGH